MTRKEHHKKTLSLHSIASLYVPKHVKHVIYGPAPSRIVNQPPPPCQSLCDCKRTVTDGGSIR